MLTPLPLQPRLGQREDNINDWALAQFTHHYVGHASSVTSADDEGRHVKNVTYISAGDEDSHVKNVTSNPITKEAIFHYVSAVLHHPVYRQTYELNLKREFPRIPFYDDFWQWVAWGKQLIDGFTPPLRNRPALSSGTN